MLKNFLKTVNPTAFRNFLFTLLAVGFALGLYSCATEAQKREATRQLLWHEGVVREWKLEGKPVIARVKIPEKYKSMPIRTPFFDEVRRIKAEENKGKTSYSEELFEVLLPTMEPRSDENAAEFDTLGRHNNKLRFLVTTYSDIAERYPVMKDSYYKSALGFSFGRYDDEAVVVGQQYGLTVVDLNAERHQELQAKWEQEKYDAPEFGDKVYFSKNENGGLITVIRCARLLDENIEDGGGLACHLPGVVKTFIIRNSALRLM